MDAPPFAYPDSELAIVGALVESPAMRPALVEALAPADFHRPHYRRLFGIVVEMIQGGAHVDLGTVTARLLELGDEQGLSDALTAATKELHANARTWHVDRVKAATRARALRLAVERADERLTATSQDGGFTSPDQLDALTAELAEAVARPAADVAVASHVERARARFKDAASYLDATPAPIPWLLKTRKGVPAWVKGGITDRVGVLPLAKVGILASMGGVGKSTALVDLAVSVAIGWPWMEAFDVEAPGAVLLVLAEDDEAEAHRKIHYAIHRAAAHVDARLGARGGAPSNLPTGAAASGERARVFAGTRIRVAALAGTHPALTLDDDVTPSAWHTAIAAQLAEPPPGGADRWALVILDPLSRFATPDAEKDNVSATRFIELAEAFAVRAADDERGTGPAVLLAHHTGKESRKEGEKVDANAIRGVGGLHDAVRWAATLTPWDRVDPIDGKPLPPSLLTFKQVKGNLGPPLPALTLARRAVAGEPPTLSIADADELAAYEAAATSKAPKATPAPGPTPTRSPAGGAGSGL